MKAVQLLVNEELPEELRDYARTYDAKDMSGLMAGLASRYPGLYAGLAKRLGDIGREAAYRQGETIGLSDMKLQTFDKNKLLKAMDDEIAALDRNAPGFGDARLAIWLKTANLMQKGAMSAAMREGSNIGNSVVSGARGKPPQLRAMLATPGLYADHFGNTIPIFVRHSFSEGLRPAELLAGTFGARASTISTKKQTAKGGDWGKQLNQAAATLVVTEADCGTDNGIDLDPDDESIRGRVLALPAAGMPAGTTIGKKEAAELRKAGSPVVVRSPSTCRAEGLCSKCVGKFYDNKFPSIGDSVGVTAAQSLSEPIVQGALNQKHTAGMASGKRVYSGFDYINQFTQVPSEFRDRAVLAEEPGMVDSVTQAPQGGFHVVVGGERHYVPAGHEVTVAPGQNVERGDELSEGLKSPADMVRLRGLGEGRRYFAERLRTMLADSGQPADARNTEILSRALLDGVVVDAAEGIGDWLPDDAVRYSAMDRAYAPPADTKTLPVHEAVGKYLQSPRLHYTIGTQLAKSMADRLDKAGYKTVDVSDEEPGFSPEMSRMRTSTHGMGDWMAAMNTSYLKKQLQDAANRGADSETGANVHFAPRLALGEGFGKHVRETGRF